MNDYLWDRSGEPDKDIQRLEEILAPLGYQPKPLEIPASVPAHRRRFLPALAIAATITLMALAVGLWFSLYRSRAIVPSQTNLANVPAENGKENGLQSTPSPETVRARPTNEKTNPQLADAGHRATGRALHTTSERRSGKVIRPQHQPEAIADTRAEAEAAKDQLMFALRLVSSKLSLAQKRAQGGYPGNLMRNQHKVG
ncbi:MAG: hypothetical protein ABJC05_00590 [Pyrinomonadaceae bacterium]